jgi:arsenate reductase
VNCPVWLGQGRVVHISFPDPAGLPGDEGLQMEAFRQVRDAIRQRVFRYLEEEL